MTARIARITQRAIAALKPGDMLTDDAIKNFTVQRLPSGTVRFGYRYRFNGHQSWSTLGLQQGAADDLTVDQARKAASMRAGEVAGGVDPVADKAKQQDDRMASVADKFIRLYVRENNAPKTVYEVEAIFRRFLLPRFGNRQMGEIRRREIAEMLDDIATENGKVMADRTLAAARKFFNWHAARTDDFVVPTALGMARTRPGERARNRILDEQELRDLWRALEQAPGARESRRFAAYVKCILLTGQRPGVVAAMQADEIVKYKGASAWKIPQAKNKIKFDHLVPLTPAVLELINPGRDGDYIFSEFRGGARPISGISKSMDRLRCRINAARRKPMPHWTRHDLRRTARSLMSRGGVIEADHAERVLGHKIAGVRGVYDVHDYFDEKLEALERLADSVSRIVNPPPSGNVVKLRKDRVRK